jgi:hypothetical protein
MNKLALLGIISGAALLAAVPFSVQWSQGSAVPLLTVSHANAQTAGMERRQARRTARRERRETRREARRPGVRHDVQCGGARRHSSLAAPRKTKASLEG